MGSSVHKNVITIKLAKRWMCGCADTDGTQLTESAVVVEYLEQRYKGQGASLVPDDAGQAAKVGAGQTHDSVDEEVTAMKNWKDSV